MTGRGQVGGRAGDGDLPSRRHDWDVVVVGLGALGSAAAWVLARAGARVLGLEQFELGHHRGASHDQARIIRRSYHTSAYVRLAGLAYQAWAELEWETEERLVVATGGLDLFPANSAIPPAPTVDATFRAGRLLLCTDAWTGDLLVQLDIQLPLVVTQEQFSYFRPADPAPFAVGRFPVWIWMDAPSFYGFPVWPDRALKAAQDVGGP